MRSMRSGLRMSGALLSWPGLGSCTFPPIMFSLATAHDHTARTTKVAPQSVYGRTKAEGEKLLVEACPGAVIVRTAWLYGQFGPNFVATML